MFLATKITRGNINEFYDIDRDHASLFVRSQYFVVCLDLKKYFAVCLGCNKKCLTENAETAYWGFVLNTLLTEGVSKISSLIFYHTTSKVSFVLFQPVTGELTWDATFMSDVQYHPFAL